MLMMVDVCKEVYVKYIWQVPESSHVGSRVTLYQLPFHNVFKAYTIEGGKF